MACLLPGGCLGLLVHVGEQVVHLEVNTVGPAEADDVALVTCGDFYVGGAADDVVLFADGAVMHKVLADRLRESGRDAARIISEPILVESLYGKPGGRSPAEGKVPLRAGVVIAHSESTIVFEERKMMLDLRCLLWTGKFRP